MSQRCSICLVAFVLIATATACAAGGSQTPSIPPAATSTTAPAPTQPLQPTVKPAASATLPPTATPTPTGTATPAETVTATPGPRPPVVTQRSRTPAAPLAVNFEVVEIQGAPNGDAQLVLKVIATGGAGGYRYYQDDVPELSATFTVPGRCGKPFVHTIKVTSADGQTVALPYLIGGQCPTPTP